MDKNIEINIGKKIKNSELKWNNDELKKIEKDIFSLSYDQLVALPFLVGVIFNKSDIEEVVDDIKDNGLDSVHLSIILSEAKSKDDVIWWIDFFKKYNSKIEELDKDIKNDEEEYKKGETDDFNILEN
jgi:hypothetical protein